MASATSSRPETPTQSDEDDDSSLIMEIPSKNEFRKQYGELIEDLNEFSMTEDSSMQKLQMGVKKSKRLFETFDGASEMYLACLHTKLLAKTIREKSEKIGNCASAFNLDKFIEALRSNNMETGNYSRTAMSTNIVKFEAMNDTNEAPALSCIYGLFDKESLAVSSSPKVKKPRAARKKQDFQKTNATQHAEANLTEEDRATKDTSAVKMSMDLLNVLQHHYKRNKKPLSLYDFTMDTTSLAKTIENIFHLGFLVRDGRISVKRDGVANLMVKPETPPEKEENTERQQHIFSFSSRQWKVLAEAAEGENIVKSYQEAQSKQPPK